MITLKDIKISDYNLYVGLLTVEQKNLLLIQLYTEDSYFNPIQDINDNWIISIEEINYCDNPEFMWVKELPLIIFEPKQL
jgi:hypothetical protein